MREREEKRAIQDYVSGTDLESAKEEARLWFRELRGRICEEFLRIEEEYDGPSADQLDAGSFKRTPWLRRADRVGMSGGGGEISVMRGRVFEKVGVNISTVNGTFSPIFRREIAGAEEDGNFWASGISLVSHSMSPLVPSVHFNTRFIVTSKAWFGGGTDLTPAISNDHDTHFFHQSLREMCGRHDEGYYERFKEWCDNYFYIKHREESRGVGGIFYDYLNTGEWGDDFNFTKDVGETFLRTYAKLVRLHMDRPFTQGQKEIQLEKRGRYAEFNLVYDRGTRFGLETNANVDAVLMSLPPLAKW